MNSAALDENKPGGSLFRKKARIGSIIIALLIFLTACGQKTDLTFYRNQSWKYRTEVRYEERLVNLFGGVITSVVSSDIGVSLPSVHVSDSMAVLDLLFATAKPDFKAKGINVSFHHARNVYTLGFQGKNFSSFNQLIPQNASIVNNGSDQYHLSMVFTRLSDMDPSLQEMETYSSALFQNTLTLHTGKIISSNANEVRGGVAVWHNPTQMEAVFTPASSVSPAVLRVIGILVIPGIAIAVGASARRKRLRVEQAEYDYHE
jgi:hypothetical protein